MPEPKEGPLRLFGDNIGKVTKTHVEEEVHPHASIERRQNLARARAKSKSKPPQSETSEKVVIKLPNYPQLEHPGSELGRGKVFVPAGTIALMVEKGLSGKEEVAYFITTQDIGVFVESHDEFVRLQRGKGQYLTDNEVPGVKYEMLRIPPAAFKAKKVDLDTFRKLWGDRTYSRPIVDIDRRKGLEVEGPIESLRASDEDKERGYRRIYTKVPVFLRTGRVPKTPAML